MDTSTSAADALLHPLRLRIIQLLLHGQQLTAGQIAQAEPSVPRATLYRHLNQLVEAGMLVVAEERQVRNLTEKVYALAGSSVYLDPADTVTMSKDDLMRLFTAFATLLMSDFERYLNTHDAKRINFQEEAVTFWQRSFLLNTAEARQIAEALNEVLEPLRGRQPSADHHRWLVSFAIMPGQQTPPAGL